MKVTPLNTPLTLLEEEPEKQQLEESTVFNTIQRTQKLEIEKVDKFSEKGRVQLKTIWDFLKGYNHVYGIGLLYLILSGGFFLLIWNKIVVQKFIVNFDKSSTF